MPFGNLADGIWKPATSMWFDEPPTEVLGPTRRWKDGLKRVLGLHWEAGFGMLGLAVPRRPTRWSSAGGLRVTVVAPHPDDEVYGCAGTLLLHARAGDQVTVCHVTDGRLSRALGLEPEAMARERRREAEGASGVLGVETDWFGFFEGAWPEESVVERLGAALERTRPDLIYAPSLVDFHPEHLRVAAAVARVLEAARAAPALRVRIYAVQVPLCDPLVNLVAGTGDVAGCARTALEQYRTQLGSLRSALRAKRYAGLRYRVGPEAETFWEVSPEIYVALHRAPSEISGSFRGLRPLPFTDPLAYVAGRGVRRLLAQAAGTA